MSAQAGKSHDHRHEKPLGRSDSMKISRFVPQLRLETCLAQDLVSEMLRAPVRSIPPLAGMKGR
jgi:hypothetical protein